MRIFSIPVSMLIGLMSVGCHSVYVPSASQSPVGYSDAPIRPGYTEVSFIGYDANQAQNLARVRAAELTAGANLNWFEVLVERTNYVQEDVWIQPTCETIVTGTTKNPDGTVEETPEEIETVPGHWETATYSMSTLLIHMLDHQTPAALNAQTWLRDAKGHDRLTKAGRVERSATQAVE